MVHLRIQDVGLEHVLFPVLSQKSYTYHCPLWPHLCIESCFMSQNRGTPKSSILIEVFIIFTIHFGGKIPLFLVQHPYRWETRQPLHSLGLSLGSFAEVWIQVLNCKTNHPDGQFMAQIPNMMFLFKVYLRLQISGQIITTSAEVTSNGGLVRESPQALGPSLSS